MSCALVILNALLLLTLVQASTELEQILALNDDIFETMFSVSESANSVLTGVYLDEEDPLKNLPSSILSVAFDILSANPLLGFAISFFDGMFGNSFDAEEFRQGILNEVEGMIQNSVIDVALEAAQTKIAALELALRNHGISEALLIDFDLAAIEMFNINCWEGSNSGTITCLEWQEAGSVYYTLPFAQLHLVCLVEYARQLSEDGDRDEAEKYLETVVRMGETYYPLLDESYANYVADRLSHVTSGYLVDRGGRSDRVCEVETWPVDEFGGLNIDLSASSCQDTPASMATTMSAGCTVLQPYVDDCIQDYKDMVNEAAKLFFYQISAFPQYYQHSG